MSGFKYFQFSLNVGASLQGLNMLEEDDCCDDEEILEDEDCPECEDVILELLLDTRLLDVGFAELLLAVFSLRELDTALSFIEELDTTLSLEEELDTALPLEELLLVSSAEEKMAI